MPEDGHPLPLRVPNGGEQKAASCSPSSPSTAPHPIPILTTLLLLTPLLALTPYCSLPSISPCHPTGSHSIASPHPILVLTPYCSLPPCTGPHRTAALHPILLLTLYRSSPPYWLSLHCSVPIPYWSSPSARPDFLLILPQSCSLPPCCSSPHCRSSSPYIAPHPPLLILTLLLVLIPYWSSPHTAPQLPTGSYPILVLTTLLVSTPLPVLTPYCPLPHCQSSPHTGPCPTASPHPILAPAPLLVLTPYWPLPHC